jgi:hypothetical protein
MRSGSEFGDPWEAVGREKERRRAVPRRASSRNAALIDLDVAFEVPAICGRRIERVPL